MKNIPSKPYLPDFFDPFFKLSSYVRADNSNNLAFCVASEDTSSIRGRIPHTQVDPHNREPVFGLEEAAHMFKAMPVSEISLAQLLFVCVWFFFCRSFFTGIEYLRAQCSTV